MWNVGTRRQLFVDERFIERSEGVRLRMNPPVQHPDPVLAPDRPWESFGIGAYNTAMLEPDGRFRLWYDACVLGGGPAEGARRLGYAESEDGLTWTKPDLGLIEFQGSKANNIVAPLLERQSMQGATVLRDEAAPEDERYKLWTKYRPTDDEMAAGFKPGLWAMHSPDGLRWRYYEGQPDHRGACDTQNMLFVDDRLDRYVGYTRVSATQHRDEAADAVGQPYRSVGRVTSTDFRNWTPLEIVFEADGADIGMPLPGENESGRPCVDIYTSCAMKYPWAEDVYLMLPAVYYHWGRKQFPGTLDVQLLTSRDGICWGRAGDREPFLRQGFDGSSTSGMIYANPWLIPVGEELWLYYSGTVRLHRNPRPGEDREALARLGGIFRASLRRDGFVSADAGYGGGTFTTPLLTFEGDRLEVNCDGSAGGWLQVEVLGEEGRPLPGLSLAEADTVRGNSLHKAVTWGGGDLAPHAGTPVRLRFVMRGMKLYAFQFRDGD